jgi:soluble lytic murein transglycosylase-like protein
MMKLLHPSLLAAGLLLCTFPASGAKVVLFEDGRAMTVSRIELREDMVLLELEGGGSIAVPAHRIANWRELETRRPASPTAPTMDAAWRREAGEFAELIGDAAERHQLDPALLTAMAQVESAFNPRAVSHKGAQGLLQLMPKTAERFGVEDVFNASQNVDGGARYLKWLLERYEGRMDLALAGYNAGEAAVDEYGGVPPYSETQNYVTRVMESASRLSEAGARSPRRVRSGT